MEHLLWPPPHQTPVTYQQTNKDLCLGWSLKVLVEGLGIKIN